MKIMTCCWFDTERIDWESGEGNQIVSISRSEPQGFMPDLKIWEFCPSSSLLTAFKHNEITEDEYREIYSKDVNKKISKGIAQLHEGDVLCCWEAEGKFCHRTILADLLSAHGIEVEIH